MKKLDRREVDEAMDAIPNLTEAQIELLIEYTRQGIAKLTGTRMAKKDQSEEDVELALDQIVKFASHSR